MATGKRPEWNRFECVRMGGPTGVVVICDLPSRSIALPNDFVVEWEEAKRFLPCQRVIRPPAFDLFGKYAEDDGRRLTRVTERNIQRGNEKRKLREKEK
ncbi:hypothetical protein RUM44_013450 [Polyplax serrata]|uniref:Uncharacterized protein n=1 Tax=Polyplax serrata TaxID=468196 RepID=A0ABR1BIH2_POLSC